MVEIIQRGKKKSEFKYELRCRECSTLFRFGFSEAKFVSTPLEDWLEIECPVCKLACTVDTNRYLRDS
jgi:hypothetical protein